MSNTSQPIYLKNIIYNQRQYISCPDYNNLCLFAKPIIHKYIQIILSNNILCLIKYEYPEILKIEFHIHNNTLQINDNIIYYYTFPNKLFIIPNNIIEILLLNEKFYNSLLNNNKIILKNISLDILLISYYSGNYSNYFFDVYNTYILQQIFNLPTKVFNFNFITDKYCSVSILNFILINLKKYHIFNYFKNIIHNIHSHIFTTYILDIIGNLL